MAMALRLCTPTVKQKLFLTSAQGFEDLSFKSAQPSPKATHALLPRALQSMMPGPQAFGILRQAITHTHTENKDQNRVFIHVYTIVSSVGGSKSCSSSHCMGDVGSGWPKSNSLLHGSSRDPIH